MVQSLFHVVNRKWLITTILSHRVILTPKRSFIVFSISLLANSKLKSTSKKSELEERLNGIFGDDAPGFQKSTVISTNKDGETFTADVLERIYTDFVHVD